MMEVKIYQINPSRDTDRVSFESLDRLEHVQGFRDVNPALYDMVFEGHVQADDLEDVYRIFNIRQPEGYAGRSLSVSDVVEVVKSDEVKSGFYFCDSIGFKPVRFDPDRTHPAGARKIKVVLVEPGRTARAAEVDSSLEGLQKAVGGYIEEYFPFDTDDVCIVCNEHGKLYGMRPCRAVYGEDKKLKDIIFGPFLVCGRSGGDFSSLSKEQLDKYTKRFRDPDHFLQRGDRFIPFCYNPRRPVRER